MTLSSQQQSEKSAFFAVPTRIHALRCLGASITVLCIFISIYSGANYLTGLRTQHLRIDFAFEQRLPFVPELTIVYSSLYLMFLLVPFVMRTRQELRHVTRVLILVTAIAGVCFLLLPAEIGFEVPSELGRFPVAFTIADRINQTYNLCPSLHVAYAVTCAELYRQKRARYGWIFHLWALAIAVAAWLTYQHHLLDLIAGYVLAMASLAVVQTGSRNRQDDNSRETTERARANGRIMS